MKKIKQIIKSKLIKNTVKNNLLDLVYGHSQSRINHRPIDKSGSAIPWYTYPAIEFLEQFDLSSKKIFEWGSGNSSTYFARKASQITSIEHDKEWYNSMQNLLLPNQKLLYSDLQNYPKQIKNNPTKFDIIIIDGQRRFDCVIETSTFLNENGMIVLDNSDWFYISAKYLREKLGLLQVDFHGFGPINNYTWTTSFFFTKNFSFPLLDQRQPKKSLGGITHDESIIIEKEDLLYNTNNSLFAKNISLE